MSVRFHTTKIYEIKYGSAIDSENTSDLLKLGYIAYNNNCGYVSENEEDIEMDKWFLQGILDKDQDVMEMLEERDFVVSKQMLCEIEMILQESDPKNDYVHLSEF